VYTREGERGHAPCDDLHNPASGICPLKNHYKYAEGGLICGSPLIYNNLLNKGPRPFTRDRVSAAGARRWPAINKRGRDSLPLSLSLSLSFFFLFLYLNFSTSTSLSTCAIIPPSSLRVDLPILASVVCFLALLFGSPRNVAASTPERGNSRCPEISRVHGDDGSMRNCALPAAIENYLVSPPGFSLFGARGCAV